MSPTHTFAILEVSKQTYEEIAEKLRAAGHDHRILPSHDTIGLDMNGICLQVTRGARGKEGGVMRKIHNDKDVRELDTCGREECGHVRKKHEIACKGLHLDPFGPAKPCSCPRFVEPRARKAPAPASPIVSVRARWDGQPPQIGEYLAARGHATKYAYRIVGVRLGKERPSDHGATAYELDAERIPIKELPSGVTVHPWKWDPRSKGDQGRVWGAT